MNIQHCVIFLSVLAFVYAGNTNYDQMVIDRLLKTRHDSLPAKKALVRFPGVPQLVKQWGPLAQVEVGKISVSPFRPEPSRYPNLSSLNYDSDNLIKNNPIEGPQDLSPDALGLQRLQSFQGIPGLQAINPLEEQTPKAPHQPDGSFDLKSLRSMNLPRGPFGLPTASLFQTNKVNLESLPNAPHAPPSFDTFGVLRRLPSGSQNFNKETLAPFENSAISSMENLVSLAQSGAQQGMINPQTIPQPNTKIEPFSLLQASRVPIPNGLRSLNNIPHQALLPKNEGLTLPNRNPFPQVLTAADLKTAAFSALNSKTGLDSYIQSRNPQKEVTGPFENISKGDLDFLKKSYLPESFSQKKTAVEPVNTNPLEQLPLRRTESGPPEFDQEQFQAFLRNLS